MASNTTWMSLSGVDLSPKARRIRANLVRTRAELGLRHVLEEAMITTASLAVERYVVLASYAAAQERPEFWAELEAAHMAARMAASELGCVSTARTRFVSLRPRGMDRELLALANSSPTKFKPAQ